MIPNDIVRAGEEINLAARYLSHPSLHLAVGWMVNPAVPGKAGLEVPRYPAGIKSGVSKLR
jgi:hypothetical protein